MVENTVVIIPSNSYRNCVTAPDILAKEDMSKTLRDNGITQGVASVRTWWNLWQQNTASGYLFPMIMFENTYYSFPHLISYS